MHVDLKDLVELEDLDKLVELEDLDDLTEVEDEGEDEDEGGMVALEDVDEVLIDLVDVYEKDEVDVGVDENDCMVVVVLAMVVVVFYEDCDAGCFEGYHEGCLH